MKVINISDQKTALGDHVALVTIACLPAETAEIDDFIARREAETVRLASSPVADDPPERLPYVTPPRDPFQEDDTGEPYTIPGCATGACGLD